MNQTPRFVGIHHVALTVSDLDRSIDWYQNILALKKVKRAEAEGLEKAVLTGGGVMLTLVSHGGTAAPGPFDEHTCGLDHLSFAVEDRESLNAWVAHLDALGVGRGQVTTAGMGDMVAFRDPDNIGLEFYTTS